MYKVGYCWFGASIDKDPFKGVSRLCIMLGEINHKGKKMYKCLIGLDNSASTVAPPDVGVQASFLNHQVAIAPYFREIDAPFAVRYESDYPVSNSMYHADNLEDEFEKASLTQFPDGVIAFGRTVSRDYRTLKVINESYELAIIKSIVGYGDGKEFLGCETDRDSMSSYYNILALPDDLKLEV